MFTRQAQHRTAGYQDLEARNGCQHLIHNRCRFSHLLKVIQHQQQLPVFQVGDQALERGQARCGLNIQRLHDTHWHQGRIILPGQLHKPHALCKHADQFACHE